MWVVFILGRTIRWNHTGFVWLIILYSPMISTRRWKFMLVTESRSYLFDFWIHWISFLFFFFFSFCGLKWLVLCNAATSQGVSCWACSVPFSWLCWIFASDYTRHSTLVLKWIGKMYDCFFVWIDMCYWYVLIIVYCYRL